MMLLSKCLLGNLKQFHGLGEMGFSSCYNIRFNEEITLEISCSHQRFYSIHTRKFFFMFGYGKSSIIITKELFLNHHNLLLIDHYPYAKFLNM